MRMRRLVLVVFSRARIRNFDIDVGFARKVLGRMLGGTEMGEDMIVIIPY